MQHSTGAHATLRDLGRSAFRAGTFSPIPFAEITIGRQLTEDERYEVMLGWRAGRNEAVRP